MIITKISRERVIVESGLGGFLGSVLKVVRTIYFLVIFTFFLSLRLHFFIGIPSTPHLSEIQQPLKT